MGDRKTLEEILEESKSWYVKDDAGWAVLYEGVHMSIEKLDEDIVRASARMGVRVTDENEGGVFALANHYGGWVQKVGEYGVAPDGELVMYVDRKIDDDTPDQMVEMLASYYHFTCEPLHRAEQGASPREAGGFDGDDDLEELLRMYRDNLQD